MISIFILPLNHFWNWDAQREELTDVQREKEREKEWLTDAQREKDRVVDHDLVKHRADRDLVKCLSRSREAPRRSQPLVESSRLSLFLFLSIWPNLMIFFLGFVCVSVLRNEWYYIFVWQPRKCDRIWWFFSRFYLCFCIEEWMILYIRLATEKMWENLSNK